MAFPETITQFPTMRNIVASDGPYVEAYQQAMEAQDLVAAQAALVQIPDYASKIFSAEFFNSIAQTLYEVERFYAARYSSAYIVSAIQPVVQETSDFWFEVTGTE